MCNLQYELDNMSELTGHGNVESYMYGDNFGRVTVTCLGSYVALQKAKHHKNQTKQNVQ